MPPLSRELRGLRLFVSKGCARCHLESWSSAPRLNPSGYKTGYLTRFLTSPPTATGDEWRMPDLGLTGDEVASLVAFINPLRLSENAVVVEPTSCNGDARQRSRDVPRRHVARPFAGNALISTGLWAEGRLSSGRVAPDS